MILVAGQVLLGIAKIDNYMRRFMNWTTDGHGSSRMGRGGAGFSVWWFLRILEEGCERLPPSADVFFVDSRFHYGLHSLASTPPARG